MSNPRAQSRISWHTAVIVLLTAALLWWFVRKLDFANVGRAIASAHLGFVAAAVLVTFQTYVIRAWRWQLRLLPLGRARFRTAFRTTVIGFTASFLLPGRVGEVLRPYLLARQENMNAAAAFATVIVERVLDMVSVLLLFSVFLFPTNIDVGRELRLGGSLAAAAAIAALVVMALSAGHPERLGRWAGRITALLPGRAAEIASRFVRTFAEGLAVMRRPTALFGSFALSLLLWLSIALGIWFSSLALDLTFSFPGSFLLLMYLVVGVAVPVPAGVGSFHAMYQDATTRFFAAPIDVAAAAAIVLHAVSFVPISILGLVLMAQDGLTIGGLKDLKATAQEAEKA